MSVDKTILSILEAEKKGETMISDAHAKAQELIVHADRDAAAWLQKEKEKLLRDKEKKMLDQQKQFEQYRHKAIEKTKVQAKQLEEKSRKKSSQAIDLVVQEFKKQVNVP